MSEEKDQNCKFRLGQKVRVKQENPVSHVIRTPEFVRGRVGCITASYGIIHNPIDHHDIFPPLYTVQFELRHLFETGDTGDKFCADLHEDWLEPAA
ncbi:MAG: SH3-like domain-containing protein [Nitrososphaerales archaeon]